MNDSVSRRRTPNRRTRSPEDQGAPSRSETHVSLSRSRSRGARTKQGTCSTCSPVGSINPLHPILAIERFMNATGYTRLIESQCEISWRRLLSLARHRILQPLERNTPHTGVACSPFTSFLLFFFICPLGRKGRERRKWNVGGGRRGGWIFASEGTVAWDLFTCP